MRTTDLTKLADLWGSHKGLKLSTVSTYAAGDGKFFHRLKEGASCTLRRAEAVTSWFSDNWPDQELEWPRSIPRPKPNKKEAA